MPVLIAPDSFKGSIGAADPLAERAPGDHVPRLPRTDGGEGTLDALLPIPIGQVFANDLMTARATRPDTEGARHSLPRLRTLQLYNQERGRAARGSGMGRWAARGRACSPCLLRCSGAGGRAAGRPVAHRVEGAGGRLRAAAAAGRRLRLGGSLREVLALVAGHRLGEGGQMPGEGRPDAGTWPGSRRAGPARRRRGWRGGTAASW
jgi:hypothetical protein